MPSTSLTYSLCRFEKELRAKLGQKSTSRTSEEQILLKAFKYFDLNNSGDVTLDEFVKAIEKVGVQTYTDEDYKQLFEFYDIDHSNSLDYKEFSAILFGNASGTSRQQTSPGKNTAGVDVEEVQVLIEKLEKILTARGPGGIIGLGKQFTIADKNKSRDLDAEEFKYALRDFGTGFRDDEISKLFTYFDKTNDGNINFDEFIYAIRGNMNNFRKSLVIQAFKKLDKNTSGDITIEDLTGVYNASHHPEVKAGRKTEKQVLNEFLDTFHGVYDYHAIHDDIVTQDEFVEYYNFISASIDNDQYFELMMNNAWRMNEGDHQNWNKRGWSGDVTTGARQGTNSSQKNYEQRLESGYKPNSSARGDNASRSGAQDDTRSQQGQGTSSDIRNTLDKIRNRLAVRGTKGFVGIQRQFKIMDDDNDKAISYKEFTKAMKDYKVDLNDQESRAVFNYFDSNGNGKVEIDEFIRSLRGEMNQNRVKIVTECFRVMDKNGDGVLRVNDIKGTYSARQHPEVKSGKKTEDEILGEFLETFEAHHHLKVGTRDQQVSLDEFIEYYNNVSANIDDDRYFEHMMAVSYKLWNSNPKYREYAPANFQPPQNNQMNRTGASNFAPFGTSNQPTDYSTHLRPSTAQSRRGDEQNVAAGTPSWTGASGNRPATSQGIRKDNDPAVLFKQFQEKVFARGARGILGLQKLFKIIDDDDSKSLSLNEFSKVLKDFRLDFTDSEAKALFGYFDETRDGTIDYDEFLHAIKGELNERRLKVIKQAFQKLDKTGDGVITLDDVRGVYDPKNHPDVKSRKKTEDQVLGDFLDTFEQYHAIRNDDPKLRNKEVTWDEFVDYYRNISCSVDNDEYFELIIKNAWNLENKSYGKGWASKY